MFLFKQNNKMIKQELGLANKNKKDEEFIVPILSNEWTSNNQQQMEETKKPENDGNPENLNQVIKRRDNIIAFLCEKVQNMESEIELLRHNQNKSSIQNLSGLQLVGLGNNGTQSQSIINQNSQVSPLNGNFDINKKIKDKLYSPNNKIEEEQSQQSNLHSQTNKGTNGLEAIEKQEQDETDFMKIKLNETSDNEGETNFLPNHLTPLSDLSPDNENILMENQYEQTADFILAQPEANESSYYDQPIQKGEKSQQIIHQAFKKLQDNLEKYEQFNNPKRIADLRKFCATSITQQTQNISEGFSSRFLDSGGNSGGTGRNPDKAGTSGSHTNKTKSNGTNTLYNRTTNRHFQSTSDADLNSLITVGEDFSKFTRQSNGNRVSDKLNPSIPIGDSSPFYQSEANQIIQHKQNTQISHKQINADNPKWLFDSNNNAIDMRDQIDVEESIIPNQAEFQDIIAQGGVLSEDEPILPGLTEIQDDEDEQEETQEIIQESRSSVIVHEKQPTYSEEKLNYALRLDNDILMDEEDDVLIRTNMVNVIGKTNSSQTNSNTNKQTTNFEDDDIRELEQMVKYHEEEENEEEQEPLQLQKTYKQNKQNFMQTQEVFNINKILKGNEASTNLRANGCSEENIYKKGQESFELDRTHQYNMAKFEQQHQEQIQQDEEQNNKPLCKTLSKDTLLKKLRGSVKQSVIKIDQNQQPMKDQQMQAKRQKIKLIQNTLNQKMMEQRNRQKLKLKQQTLQVKHINNFVNENFNSMERKLNQLEELEQNEGPLFSLLQETQNNNDSSIPIISHSNTMMTSNIVGLQGQGQEQVENNICNNSDTQTQNNNSTQPAGQIIDTTFQPFNISTTSQNQSSYCDNASFLTNQNKLNFAQSVAQQAQQTPNKRIIKKKKPVVNTTQMNTTTNNTTQNQTQLQQFQSQANNQNTAQNKQFHALIQLQNKAPQMQIKKIMNKDDIILKIPSQVNKIPIQMQNNSYQHYFSRPIQQKKQQAANSESIESRNPADKIITRVNPKLQMNKIQGLGIIDNRPAIKTVTNKGQHNTGSRINEGIQQIVLQKTSSLSPALRVDKKTTPKGM